jgi:hypothetical protein
MGPDAEGEDGWVVFVVGDTICNGSGVAEIL